MRVGGKDPEKGKRANQTMPFGGLCQRRKRGLQIFLIPSSVSFPHFGLFFPFTLSFHLLLLWLFLFLLLFSFFFFFFHIISPPFVVTPPWPPATHYIFFLFLYFVWLFKCFSFDALLFFTFLFFCQLRRATMSLSLPPPPFVAIQWQLCACGSFTSGVKGPVTYDFFSFLFSLFYLHPHETSTTAMPSSPMWRSRIVGPSTSGVGDGTPPSVGVPLWLRCFLCEATRVFQPCCIITGLVGSP